MRFRDQPLPPLELAKFWVEYVARHKGAPHLHSSGQDLDFIVYHNIDVFVFVGASIGFLIYIVYWLVTVLIAFACGSKGKSQKSQSNSSKKRR